METSGAYCEYQRKSIYDYLWLMIMKDLWDHGAFAFVACCSFMCSREIILDFVLGF
jgi:hypothetical protein